MLRLLPVVTSGVLLGMAYPPGAIPGLGFAALAPLLIRWTHTSQLTEAYGEAVLAHVIAYGIAFRWVAFHPIPSAALASVGGVLTLSLLAALPYGAAPALTSLAARLVRRARASRPNDGADDPPSSVNPEGFRPHSARMTAQMTAQTRLLSYGVLAALVVITEALLARGPWAMPWTTLSLTIATLPQASWGTVVGGAGLSALVIASNGVLAEAWRSLRHAPRQANAFRPRTVVFAGLVLAVVLAFPTLNSGMGGSSASSINNGNESTLFAITVVQPARPPLAWSSPSDTTRVDDMIRRTRRALSNQTNPHSHNPHAPLPTDLVVWPESTLPATRGADRTRMLNRIQATVDSMGVPLLTGAVAPAPPLDGRPRYRNRVRLFLPHRLTTQTSTSLSTTHLSLTYDKHHLVPFAEHVPFVDDWPALQRLAVPAGGVAGYVRGDGPALFSIPTGPQKPSIHVAPLICFETVIGPYVDEAARRADVVVAVSQVGWWGPSGVLTQYRALTRLRAIETARPIVVATVTGPSFVAQPDGTVDVLTTWMSDTAGRVVVDVSR